MSITALTTDASVALRRLLVAGGYAEVDALPAKYQAGLSQLESHGIVSIDGINGVDYAFVSLSELVADNDFEAWGSKYLPISTRVEYFDRLESTLESGLAATREDPTTVVRTDVVPLYSNLAPGLKSHLAAGAVRRFLLIGNKGRAESELLFDHSINSNCRYVRTKASPNGKKPRFRRANIVDEVHAISSDKRSLIAVPLEGDNADEYLVVNVGGPTHVPRLLTRAFDAYWRDGVTVGEPRWTPWAESKYHQRAIVGLILVLAMTILFAAIAWWWIDSASASSLVVGAFLGFLMHWVQSFTALSPEDAALQ